MYQCLIAVPTTPPTWGTFLNSALLLVVGAIITFGLWSIQRKVTKIGEVTDEKAQCLDDRDDLILDAISANLEPEIGEGEVLLLKYELIDDEIVISYDVIDEGVWNG